MQTEKDCSEVSTPFHASITSYYQLYDNAGQPQNLYVLSFKYGMLMHHILQSSY